VAEVEPEDPIPEFIIERGLGYKVAPNFAADLSPFRKRHEALADNTVQGHEKGDDLLPWRTRLLEDLAQSAIHNMIPDERAVHAPAQLDPASSFAGNAFEELIRHDDIGAAQLE